MRCVIYSRVSTDAQERDGTSLETQERACSDFALSSGWTIVENIRDTASGYTLDRPGVERVRALMRQQAAEVVLTFAVDRLSRNQNHIGVLFDDANQFGVRLDFVTERFEDTAVGRFILAARAFVAEVEREKIVERTQRGKTQRAKAGKLPQATGRGMYGYRYNVATGTRDVEPVEAAVVMNLFERFAGGESCHGLASYLNAAAVPAFGGGKWYPLTVRRLLLNEAYTGRTIFRRTKAEKYRDGRTGKTKRIVSERDESEWIDVIGATPAIVSGTLYQRTKAIFDSPERRSRSSASREYPLRGRMRCGHCGALMNGQSLNRGRFLYYRCRHSYGAQWEERCESRYIRCAVVENAVRTALRDMLSEPDRILYEARRLSSEQAGASELSAIANALNDVETKQRRLVRLFTEGDLPAELLDEQRRELSARRSHLETERMRLEGMQASVLDLGRVARELPSVVLAIRSWVERSEGDTLSLLVAAVDAKIVVSAAEVRIEGSIPLYESGETLDLVTKLQTSA